MPIAAMAAPVLPNRIARRHFLARHALAETPRRALDREKLRALIERLGFVQLDSINTLARAHDLILFSRADSYRPTDLERLHGRHADVFEHWTHDAAVIPTAFFPYWRIRFERDRARLREIWTKNRRPGFEAALDRVRAHVQQRGETRAADLLPADRPKKGGAGWWDWSPEKTALEYLWRAGELAVARRDAFRKIYDLAERVIPAPARAETVDPTAAVDWACSSALRRLGVATPGEIAAFFDTVSPAEAKAWAARHADVLEEVGVECASGAVRGGLAFRDEVQGLCADGPEPPSRIRALSPFDPALRDRARAERLFGFRYRIEVFTPAAKRAYGYYVFPLLEGDRVIGRIDMKAERDAGALRVTGLWLEPGVRAVSGRFDRLDAELDRLRRFADLDRVDYADGWRRG